MDKFRLFYGRHDKILNAIQIARQCPRRGEDREGIHTGIMLIRFAVFDQIWKPALVQSPKPDFIQVSSILDEVIRPVKIRTVIREKFYLSPHGLCLKIVNIHICGEDIQFQIILYKKCTFRHGLCVIAEQIIVRNFA